MIMKIFLYSIVLLFAFIGYRSYAKNPASLIIGTKAPSFNLPDAKGEMVSLASFKDKWVVLYFYPKDDTPACTAEACSFRDDLNKLEKLGAKVVGVSVDSGSSHTEFAKKYKLPFPLLSDREGLVASQYGALTNLFFVKIAKRYTFLISPDGVLQKMYLSVDTSRHSQQIIDDLKTIQQQKL